MHDQMDLCGDVCRLGWLSFQLLHFPEVLGVAVLAGN